MKTWAKVGLGLLGFLVVFFGFLMWYKIHFSMAPAKEFEVNDPSLEHRVLIATQGSEFKDQLVNGVVEKLSSRPAYIKVIDVTKLQQQQPDDWTVVLVIHTWENWQPQEDAGKFAAQYKEKNNIVFFCTSGDGGYKIEGVDAITAASVLTDVPRKVDEVMLRVDQVLSLKGAVH